MAAPHLLKIRITHRDGKPIDGMPLHCLLLWSDGSQQKLHRITGWGPNQDFSPDAYSPTDVFDAQEVDGTVMEFSL